MANMKNKLSFTLDLRLIIGVLIAVIVAMLLMWSPWTTAERSDEVIKVTGEAVLKAEPDEYTFSPSFTATNADKAIALAEATKKGNAVVAELKELGVPESKIKTHLDGYENKRLTGGDTDDITYNFLVTINVESRDLSQKIQDYLVSAGAQGSVTPYATFSETKRNELEAKARDEATKDARTKAEQSAENLGFRLGRVKSVEDGSGFGDIFPVEGRAVAPDSGSSSSGGISLQPGENELRYSVTVTYFVR
jgi:uncharacterized protein YggE